MTMAIHAPNGTLLEVLGKGEEGEEQLNPKDNLEGEEGNHDGCGGPPPHRGGQCSRGGMGGACRHGGM